MVYSSSLFLFAFFPFFFLIYYLVPYKIKNPVIIIGSLLFCVWGMRSFLLIVIGTLLVDWILGKLVYESKKSSLRYRLLITLDVIINLGLLLYFKYFNFFCDNINSAFQAMGINPFTFTRVILPIGVSFVIFQKMTYVLDIAKGYTKPAKNFFYVFEYLLIFPQVIAGPIVKYNDLADQIQNREITWNDFITGFSRFSVGLFKKVWIADVLANYADIVFEANTDGNIPFDYAWIGLLAYTFQIFFDFSGYSDMAIGMLRMMGFHIGENFNMPYISKSITEFWKRWHISMTSWFREYLYFPLGGNRKGKARMYINQWIVFLVSGFWHGAAWNYIFWGVYHGTILCLEKAFVFKKQKKPPLAISWVTTMLLVMVGWIFFRAENITSGFKYVLNMFNFTNYYTKVLPDNILIIDNRGWFIFALAAAICFVPLCGNFYEKFKATLSKKRKTIVVATTVIFLLCVLKIITASFSPFIYFQF